MIVFGGRFMSMHDLFERIPIQSDNPEVVRRSRLFVAICVAFGSMVLMSTFFFVGLPLELALKSLMSNLFILLSFSASIWLSLRGMVDRAALLSGGVLSVCLIAFNFAAGDGAHDVVWLLTCTIIVVSTGLRASKIWIYMVFNMLLCIVIFAHRPDHYWGEPSNPIRGPVLVLTLLAIGMGMYMLLSSHERSFERAHQSAQEALIAKREAERLNYVKTQFLANMSHELRTPLNAIKGYTELIQEELEDVGCVDDYVQKDLQNVGSSAAHLLSLIDNILDLSKIESGKMNFEWSEFSLNVLCQELGEYLSPLAHAQNNKIIMDFTHGEATIMYSDRLRVKQILINLLSNAIKFTSHGSVTVSVEEDRCRNGFVCVSVKDTGLGMTEEQMSRVFKVFEQADISTTRQYGGTGLGLTLCKKVSELLGGEISVVSEYGKGSCFMLKLPVRSIAEEESKSTPPLQNV